MTDQPDRRPDGKAYIDEVTAPITSHAESSGSSVELEDDDISVQWSPPTSPGQTMTQEVEDSDEAWDMEDEDWDLAQGDFTKQYNRARQAQAATQQQGIHPPIPARNINYAKAGPSRVPLAGPSVNPKSTMVDKDKSDRATQDQVLDGRTRLVLRGLVSRGVIGKLEHCISTGKEANVYYASGLPEAPIPRLAVKIYRTSILAFRARSDYIIGEHRFRGEYSSSKNPRKMVRVWCEKELRNLRRLEQGDVRTPRVLDAKENVLVMELLGNPAPRLKDADIPAIALPSLYEELVRTMRQMYRQCKLVHADLSEYNILYHDDHLYIIDVSQSVERDHPRAFDFLRKDITNVEEYFARRDLKTLGVRRTWDYIVTAEDGDAFSEWLQTPVEPTTDDAVFMAAYIPRTLGEIQDPERDMDREEAQGDRLVANTAEMNPESDDDDGSALSDDSNPAERKPRGFRHEDPQAKKERKQAVKEERREKRKNKMPKGVKQQLVKKTARSS